MERPAAALDLQATFQEIGGFGAFQVLVCLTGAITCCLAGSVIAGGAFNNLLACRINGTDLHGNSSAGQGHGFKTSVGVEFGLCGDRATLGELSSVFLLAGCIPGSLLAGPVADTVGRIPGTLIGFIGTVTANVLATLAPVFWLHLASRAVCGFFISWTLGSIFVYGNEVLMTEHRSRFVKLYNLGPAIGSIVLAYLAYVVRDYKLLMTANNLVAVPSIIIVALLPESPSWLMSQRRGSPERVKAALRRIAWINRWPSPARIAAATTADSPQPEAQPVQRQRQEPQASQLKPRRIGGSLFSAVKCLLSDRIAIAQLLSTCLYGFSSGFSYYGFTFVTAHVVPNIYITIALMGAVEPPSLLLLNVLSRSQTLFLSALTTVAFCLAIGGIFAFVPAGDVTPGVSVVLVGLAVGGKFVSNIAFCTIVAVGAEIFPTAARNTGLGLLLASLRTGCMLSPLVNFIPHMPARFGVLGVGCLLAAFPARLLPDTRGRDLTDGPGGDGGATGEAIVLPTVHDEVLHASSSQLSSQAL